MRGYPRIVYGEAFSAFGEELVEHITAQGFVVVPVEEFVLDHLDAKSALWDHLNAQGVGTSIASAPLPLYRLVLSQWNPTQDNPYAAKRSPQTPLSESDIRLLEALHRRDQSKGAPSRLETSELCENTPPRT